MRKFNKIISIIITLIAIAGIVYLILQKEILHSLLIGVVLILSLVGISNL